jgi:hypothetical protein
MDYKRIYKDIVDKAQMRTFQVGVYTEKHHITPKSLGGKDRKANLVSLTAREHFICHLLLVKMQVKGSPSYFKMVKAFFMMSRVASPLQERSISSRSYFSLKEAFSEACRIQSCGERNSQYGRKRSEASKAKTRETLLRFYLENPSAGKDHAATRAASGKTPRKRKCPPLSTEHRAKISLAAKRKWKDPSYQKRHADSMYKVYHTKD